MQQRSEHNGRLEDLHGRKEPNPDRQKKLRGHNRLRLQEDGEPGHLQEVESCLRWHGHLRIDRKPARKPPVVEAFGIKWLVLIEGRHLLTCEDLGKQLPKLLVVRFGC